MNRGREARFTLSVDWEDFGQLLGRQRSGKITPPLGAIERQTGIILDLLDRDGRRATFFVLGMLARYRPGLVKTIASRGHEIALHGESHVDMRRLNPEAARQDLQQAWDVVTNIIGDRVYGYRAPYFSVDASNFYLLGLLAELGLTYDSSIFPVKLRRYGVAGFPREDALYRLENGLEIVELPLTVALVGGRRVPVAGGGYLRVLPGPFVGRLFRRLHEAGENVMLYMHPYEFDTHALDCRTNYPPDIPRSGLRPLITNLRWNLFRNSIRRKLGSLLENYDFVTCRERAEHVKASTDRSRVLGREE